MWGSLLRNQFLVYIRYDFHVIALRLSCVEIVSWSSEIVSKMFGMYRGTFEDTFRYLLCLVSTRRTSGKVKNIQSIHPCKSGRKLTVKPIFCVYLLWLTCQCNTPFVPKNVSWTSEIVSKMFRMHREKFEDTFRYLQCLVSTRRSSGKVKNTKSISM